MFPAIYTYIQLYRYSHDWWPINTIRTPNPTFAHAHTMIRILLGLLFCLLFINFSVLNTVKKSSNSTKKFNFNINDDLHKETSNKLVHIDCKSTKMPCVSNIQCQKLCTSWPNTIYRCKDFHCHPYNIDETKQTITEKNCNIKHGVIPLLRAFDVLNLFWNCSSLYKHIWTDNDQKQPFACNGGSFDIDLTKETLTLIKCRCPPNHIRGILKEKPHIPKCIHKDQVMFYINFIQI